MTTIAETWQQKGEQIGKQLGEQIGEQRGEQRTRREDLRKLLSKRFGELPEAISQQLNQADEQQLTAWFDHALDADSLEEVFC